MAPSGPKSQITRRQFVGGAAVSLAGLALSPANSSMAEMGVEESVVSGAPLGRRRPPSEDPSLRTGIRGGHPGSSRVAHQMAFQGRRDWGDVSDIDEIYDLVIVGAGISGLSAAHLYRKKHPNARVLLIDNHDDFGGHAKRNKFELDGRMYLGSSGSKGITPMLVTDAMEEILDDIGCSLDELEDAGIYDEAFYERHGLEQSCYFDEATYGKQALVRANSAMFLGVPMNEEPTEKSIGQMPFSQKGRRELGGLYEMNEDRTPGSIFSEFGILSKMSYQQLLTEHCGVTDPQLLEWLRASTAPSGLWGDSMPASLAVMAGSPGIGGTSFRLLRHERIMKLQRRFMPVLLFPDGNYSIARLLVRKLIPDVSKTGSSFRDILSADFDYDRLDRGASAVRIRLNSTVVNVEHDGDPGSADCVSVTYVDERDDTARRVRGRNCILACWHNVIPYIWKEQPAEQAEAQGKCLKLPVGFTNVLLRNWRPMARAGASGVYSPSYLHTHMMLDTPLNFGDYRAARSPDEPIVLFLWLCVRGGNSPSPDPKIWTRVARQEMMQLTYEGIETDLRRQLADIFGPYGFDFDRDVAGLTVNLWPHGYTSEQSTVFGPGYEDGEYPHEIARRPLGRVAIANVDSQTFPLFNFSMEHAQRAVKELAD